MRKVWLVTLVLPQGTDKSISDAATSDGNFFEGKACSQQGPGVFCYENFTRGGLPHQVKCVVRRTADNAQISRRNQHVSG